MEKNNLYIYIIVNNKYIYNIYYLILYINCNTVNKIRKNKIREKNYD